MSKGCENITFIQIKSRLANLTRVLYQLVSSSIRIVDR
jgi:hypothetical protein